MNLRMVDLNLLLVFDMVASERSVTKAAARLNITQSAISQSLGRLRSALGDELFLRTPGGMEPTPFCLQIAGPVREALDTLQTALRVAAPFDPLESKHSFTIAVDNRSAVMLAAPLALHLAERAKGVTLNLIPSGTLDIFEALDDGEIDLALGSLTVPAVRFMGSHLFEDSFVVLLRRGHPALQGDALTPARIAAYPHLEVSSTREKTAFIDEALSQLGLSRRITLRAPLLSAAPALAASNMISIISERGGRAFAEFTTLQVAAIPFETPSVQTAMLWHRRHQHVPAQKWIRNVIQRYVETSMPVLRATEACVV